MKNLAITLIFLFSISFSSKAQTIKAYKKAAEKEIENGNYYAALKHYKTITLTDSTNAGINFDYAQTARKYNAYSLANKYYLQVLDCKKSEKYVETTYWIGKVNKYLGNYATSISYLQKAINTPNLDTQLIADAKKELEYLDWAKETKGMKSNRYTIKPLDDKINTPSSEFAPFLLQDNLYFSTYAAMKDTDDKTDRGLFNIYSSEKLGQRELLKISPNLENQVAHTTFSTDKNTMYFTVCHNNPKNIEKIICELYSQTKSGNGFKNPQKVKGTVNIPDFTVTNPAIGFDNEKNQEFILFSSDRPGTKGGMDIWKSYLNEDGSFGNPQNLSAINTIGDDITPFFHNMTQTLYFSSNGYKNLGGFDIYKSTYSDTGFGTPEHMEYPINDSYNDIYFFLNEKGNKAYLASNRLTSTFLEEENEACCNDIYEVNIKPLLLTVTTFNKRTKEKLEGVKVSLIETKNLLDTSKGKKTNKHLFDVFENFEYMIIGKKEGFSSDTTYVSTQNLDRAKELVAKLYLMPNTYPIQVLTFDLETKEPLKGTEVIITECKLKELAKKTNKKDNNFSFTLPSCGCYYFTASKEGYLPGDNTLLEKDIDPLKPTVVKVYLKQKPQTGLALKKYIPLPIFFANDTPNPGSTSPNSSDVYDDNYESYYAMKSLFISEYSKGLTSEAQRMNAAAEINDFFEHKLVPGYSRLQEFTSYLFYILDKGESLELTLQGFASPKATTAYNQTLTSRRIASIRNYFNSYNNGQLKKFIQNGQLKLKLAPFGENKSASGISDSQIDLKNSVFSPRASYERRVEIIGVD